MKLLIQFFTIFCLINARNGVHLPTEKALNQVKGETETTQPSPLNYLLTKPESLTPNIGDSESFDIYFSNAISEEITVSLSCAGEHCNTFDGRSLENYTLTPGQPRVRVNLTLIQAGHDVIEVKLINSFTNISTRDAFVRIRVGHSSVLHILAVAFGWLYFFAWSVSYWPQGIDNYRRKSVVGFNFDFALLHWTGFIFYAIFNCGLYFSAEVREEYEGKFPRSEIPVEVNDAVYSIHALLATTIPWVQCFIYERGDQRVSLYGKLFQLAVWLVGAILLGLSIANLLSWLNFIYFFSYVKLTVTALKYLPQVIFNIRRKSTAGWSIYMIYLDVVGGVMSTAQMLTIAYNYNDWKTLLGNLPKLGLALASLFYDVIFLLQEYVFYPASSQAKAKPRNSLANLSLRSSFRPIAEEDDDDDGETLGDFLRKRFSVVSIKSTTLFRSKSNASETRKDSAKSVNNSGNHLSNGRSKSLANSP